MVVRSRTKPWWLRDVLPMSISLAIVIAAVVLTPSPHLVSLFGWDIPEVCASRRLFDMNCLGCGLTRSFTYMAHLQVGQAWEMHRLGPFFFLVVAWQIPYRTYLLIAEYRDRFVTL